MWVTIGYADADAMITRTIANSLPMTPRSRSQFLRTRFFVSPASAFWEESSHGREKASIGLGFEDEVYAFCFTARNGHFLRLIAVGLVEGRHRILARRQIGQRETTVGAGDRVVGILHDRKSPMHPGMDIAFDRNEFHLVVLIGDRRSAWRLGLVPLTVDLSQRVDVMRSLILVRNLEFLVRLKRQDMRQIAAAFLRQYRSFRRWRLIGSSRRNVHHHIFQRVVRTGYDRFRRRRRRILLRAAGLFGHIDGLLLGRCPLIGYLAAHGAATWYCRYHSSRGKDGYSRHKSLLGSHALTPPEVLIVPKLLFDTGTRGCAGDFLGLNDFSAFFGSHPKGELWTLGSHLQRAQVVHQIPGIFRLDDVGERGHRGAIQAGHENLVQVMVCGAALEAGTRCKIVGADGLIIAVGQRCSRWSIASALLPVAFPAFQLGEELLPVLDAIQGDRGFGRNFERIAGLVRLPARREGLDESDHIRPLLFGEGIPRRHV